MDGRHCELPGAYARCAAAQFAEALGRQLVFVGGAVAGPLITDPAMRPIPSTRDADVVCSVVTLANYYRIGKEFRERGFMEDVRAGAPNCRCYLAEQLTTLMAQGAFVEAISGYLPGDAASQRRLPGVRQTLQLMAELPRP